MKATQSANVDTLLIVIFIYAVGNSANTQREVKTAISAKKKQKHHYWYFSCSSGDVRRSGCAKHSLQSIIPSRQYIYTQAPAQS